MRFFITGKLQSSKGPRQILSAALGMLFLFIIIHGLQEFLSLGIKPQSISQQLHKDTDFGSQSPLVIMEDMHIYLLLFTMVLLLLGSLIYHLPIGKGEKFFFYLSYT